MLSPGHDLSDQLVLVEVSFRPFVLSTPLRVRVSWGTVRSTRALECASAPACPRNDQATALVLLPALSHLREARSRPRRGVVCSRRVHYPLAARPR